MRELYKMVQQCATNEELRNKIERVKTKEELISVLKTEGINVSLEDLDDLTRDEELDEEILSATTGGAVLNQSICHMPINVPSQEPLSEAAGPTITTLPLNPRLIQKWLEEQLKLL